MAVAVHHVDVVDDDDAVVLGENALLLVDVGYIGYCFDLDMLWSLRVFCCYLGSVEFVSVFYAQDTLVVGDVGDDSVVGSKVRDSDVFGDDSADDYNNDDGADCSHNYSCSC